MQSKKWDTRFMRVASEIASWSKDHTTKVGCIIVSPKRDIKATGYNGFPRGFNDDVDSRHERPAKYAYTEHAERNALYAAARLGTSLEGCTAYIQLFPCMDCARALVQCGITIVVSYCPNLDDERWGQDFKYSLELFKEVGVEVRYLEKPNQVSNKMNSNLNNSAKYARCNTMHVIEKSDGVDKETLINYHATGCIKAEYPYAPGMLICAFDEPEQAKIEANAESDAEWCSCKGEDIWHDADHVGNVHIHRACGKLLGTG